MYTQCPKCESAFQVTAEVLKQGAGRVRCGRCENGFDALAFLSEEPPPLSTIGPEDAELTAESVANDGLPQTISAEQSAALLKTLDELAGSDIRIEDTGVEWRVLDRDDAANRAVDEEDDEPVPAIDLESTNVDEILDDTAATPIDELLTASPELVEAQEIFDEPTSNPANVTELRFDDNTPLPEDFEGTGIQVPLAELEEDAASDPEELGEAIFYDVSADLALSDPDEWQDILGEFQDLADDMTSADEEDGPLEEHEPVEEYEPVEEHELAVSDLQTEDEISEKEETMLAPTTEELLDVDTQFALQAEAMGIDTARFQIDDDSEDGPDRPGESDDGDDLEGQAAPADTNSDAGTHGAGEQLDLAMVDEHLASLPVPEDEQTLNMQIDEHLMALAVEDEEGFASTIVFAEKDLEAMAAEDMPGMDEDISDDINHDGDDEVEPAEHSKSDTLFESIVMEGDDVRTVVDTQQLLANTQLSRRIAEAAEQAKSDAIARSQGESKYFKPAIAVLLVLLLVQLVHQNREQLATIPVFASSVGSIYSATGNPINANWDVTGWRFEATNGSAGEQNDELNIYSRIGNESDSALPFPLIGISLTDRFEETIGSRILEPAEYLPAELDPRNFVAPGDTFDAEMTIVSGSEDATGFKLNVCYRAAGGLLRCAVDDFK